KVSWSALAGRSYQAQYKTNLNQPDWLDVAPSQQATDSIGESVDSSSMSSVRFYRVVLLP
ncbi:MAG TPA: hypothetical protein VLT36_08360, partial [Candidatus Dormibacteraeota bacterium]|nr:hypothetical protein [Candidatus Dormibacteraeota bacterium]